MCSKDKTKKGGEEIELPGTMSDLSKHMKKKTEWDKLFQDLPPGTAAVGDHTQRLDTPNSNTSTSGPASANKTSQDLDLMGIGSWLEDKDNKSKNK